MKFSPVKFYLAKYLSLMFSGTDTLDTSSLVEVATKYLWFTLLRKRSFITVDWEKIFTSVGSR